MSRPQPSIRRRSRWTVPAALPGRIVVAGSVLAWITMLWLSLPTGAAVTPAHHHGSTEPMVGAGPSAPAAVDALSFTWASGWLLMVAGMMWPLLVPTVNRVSRAGFPRWRPVLTATTLLTSTLLWMGLGLAAALVAQLAAVPVGSLLWQLAFLAVAVLAWRSARRSRLLWRCSKLPPIAPSGWRGVRSAAQVGIVDWKRCALLCGPLMVAMVVGHNLVFLVAASLSVWWEAWHPRARRDRVPLALIVVAGLGAVRAGMLSS